MDSNFIAYLVTCLKRKLDDNLHDRPTTHASIHAHDKDNGQKNCR